MRATFFIVFFIIISTKLFPNETIIRVYLDRIEINGNNFYSKDNINIKMIKCALNGEKYIRKKLKNGTFKYVFLKSKLVLYSSSKDKEFYVMQFSFLEKKHQFRGKLYILDSHFTNEDPLCFDSNVKSNMCNFPDKNNRRLIVFRSEETGVVNKIDVRLHHIYLVD